MMISLHLVRNWSCPKDQGHFVPTNNETSWTPRVSECWYCSIMFYWWCGQTLINGGRDGSCSTLHMPFQLSIADGGSLSTLHMSLQLSTANGWWGVVLLHITHVTSTLNCWWGVGPPHHCICHFNSQLPIGAPPHCTCHFNSQLPMADGGVGWNPPHFTSSESHIIWRLVGG